MARTIGRSRGIVVVAVVAVLLAAFSLFLLGVILTATSIWTAWASAFHGDVESANLSVRFLEIVTVMLKAVVFYLIGVGLYSLFISPLNLTLALGVETLNDLEAKIISVVVVIMAVTFLERFIRWEDPTGTLLYALGMAAVVAALVFFQIHTRREGTEQRSRRLDLQDRARREMFEERREVQHIEPRTEHGDANPAQGSSEVS